MTEQTRNDAGIVRYHYRALRTSGVVERGVVQARSRDDAHSSLASRGLFALELREASPGPASVRGLPTPDLALGLRILADLLAAGLPLPRALAGLQDLAPGRWHEIAPELRRRVREGRSLSASLSDLPVALPLLVVGLIQAGEAGSGLTEGIRRAADVCEQSAALRSSLRAALAYPIVLVSSGMLSLTLLVSVVLPRFASILRDLGQDLPTSTRLVLEAGEVSRAAAMPAVLLIAALTAVWWSWRSTPAGLLRWHELLLAAPVVGRIRHSTSTAHACVAVSALLENGVPISQALMHGARAAGDAAVSARVLLARDEVIHGGRLSAALEKHAAATPTAVRLARAGEESGRLAGMLAHAAAIERDRTTQLVRTAVRLIEPLLILLFGAVVALVAAALLQAMYSLRPGS